ncbi:ribose transport system substrate-binding protein [Tessaracoccus bendigoensis DSM 12906]|uniref:Ribose transport system substrate-binding protein n=1 Tax=Tessaracoccus bendigoensis DSM 12906 TaxID=1123357 RepID=A0A1M6GGI3_9ACTN|nr:substrate-binding domain-containing protein [Tessaracoccus bendigoensis]SHJ09045.1 ribose transport system substrate-binding protein [Tessaracoccus bendigoensis DSM 12906]
MKSQFNRRIIGAVAATALTITLTACGQGGNEANGEGNSVSVAIIAKFNAGEFWVAARQGAMAAGEDLGVDVSFNGPDTENEGEKQLNQLQAAINANPDGIGFAAQNGAEEGAPAMLDEAKANGIDIVAFATPMSFSDAPIATVASNNEKMGQMAAEHLAELLGGKGKVAVITNGMVGDAAVRRDSFIEHLAEIAPDIEVVDVQDGQADRAISLNKAQGILQAHPDLNAFFGTSDNATIAAADQVSAMSKDVRVVGIDATPEMLDMIRDGEISGIVTQNAFEVGYQTVQVLADAAADKLPESDYIDITSVWADADNLDDPEVQKALGF